MRGMLARAAALLGSGGREQARKDILTTEIAGPTMTGIRPIVGGHPAQGLTPQRLASILRAAEHGDAMSYLELAEEMEEKEPRYTAVLGTRKRQCSQLDITVDPASDSAEDEANAELVRLFVEREELEDELFDILDSIGKGYSVTEIIWETSERQWMPERLKWRMPQWFEIDRTDGETLYLRRDPTSPLPMSPPGSSREPTAFQSRDLAPLPPYKFIRHRTAAKSGLPIRGGFARIVSWWYLFKNYTVKDWVIFAEVYGQPLRVGKYHSGATNDEKEVLLKALASIGTDAAAMIPEGMLIEFVQSQTARANADIYAHLVDYIDQLITMLVLGQNLTTQVQEGSRAAAQVHDEVRADIERSDCRQLGASLTRDVAIPLVILNRGPQKAYPRIKIGRPEQADVAVLSDALAKLVPLGLRVGQAEVRRKIGVEDPEDDTDLLRAPAPPPNPFDASSPDDAPPGPDDEEEEDDAEEEEDTGDRQQRRRTASSLRRATAARGAIADQLQIDDEAERLAGGWERALGRRVREIIDLAESSGDLETFRARLVDLAGREPDGELLEALERIGFNARLWGYWRTEREDG